MNTREQVIAKALAEGKDPHKATAAWQQGVPEEDVTPEMRQTQKAFNHAYLYGQAAERIFL